MENSIGLKRVNKQLQLIPTSAYMAINHVYNPIVLRMQNPSLFLPNFQQQNCIILVAILNAKGSTENAVSFIELCLCNEQQQYKNTAN